MKIIITITKISHHHRHLLLNHPFFPQQLPPPLPPISVPSQQPFLPPKLPTLPSYQQHFSQQQKGEFPTQLKFPSTDLFGLQVVIKEKEEETKDKVLEEIDDKVYEYLIFKNLN